MPNEQNLIPLDKRTKSEQRKIQSMGGCSSGVSRRRKKSLREAAELYLSLPVSDKRAWNRLSREGVEPEDVDNQMAIIAGLAMKAMKGDSKAAKVLFDLIGPAEQEPEPTGVESMTLADKMAAIREAARNIDH
mgnify:FL=1